MNRKPSESERLAIDVEETYSRVSEFAARLELRWPLGQEVPPPFVRRVRDRCRELEADLRMLRARLDVRLADYADLATIMAAERPVRAEPPLRQRKGKAA